ncbi:DMT family transporter [Neorhizobium sp. NCHU2750]|uniref:DMT family transporter n=1 Tax=Neorhizobium sp. NCHU2750 TaxID=1825976 RepID=UPI000EB62109|nr:hypothetical protein NCHU2750_08040 [Neorhizobium sp. NCHU2750]
MLISEIFAVSAAVCSALSSMLISELNGRVAVLRLARWQLTASFLFTSAAATVLDGWRTLGWWQIEMLVASGFAGIVIASTTYLAAIYAAGPRVTALLFSLASPFALLFGYLIYGETISLLQACGVSLIIIGIVVAIGVRRREPPPLIPLADGPQKPAPAGLLQSVSTMGIVLGVITALGQASGSLLARPAMISGVEPFAGMAVRCGFAAICYWSMLAVPFLRRRSMASKGETFRRQDFGIAIAAAFFGTSLGTSLLLAALQTGSVGIVSTLSSMTPIVILPMVWIRSGQMPRAYAWGGALLAIIGTTMLSLN